jgi:hypothetical protein
MISGGRLAGRLGGEKAAGAGPERVDSSSARGGVDVAGRPRTSTAGLRGARGRGRVIAEKPPRTDRAGSEPCGNPRPVICVSRPTRRARRVRGRRRTRGC